MAAINAQLNVSDIPWLSWGITRSSLHQHWVQEGPGTMQGSHQGHGDLQSQEPSKLSLLAQAGAHFNLLAFNNHFPVYYGHYVYPIFRGNIAKCKIWLYSDIHQMSSKYQRLKLEILDAAVVSFLKVLFYLFIYLLPDLTHPKQHRYMALSIC